MPLNATSGGLKASDFQNRSSVRQLTCTEDIVHRPVQIPSPMLGRN